MIFKKFKCFVGTFERTWNISNIIIKNSFTEYRTNFRPAEKFDRTLRSQGTVQYFRSVHTELGTATRLNFITVKAVPCEQKN